ncbi:MAG: hypothetical protein EOO01_00230 [Chitinophagaceae bacterium]|nr:MAG: hypothetical protein EOO01_00230 [Chitinophagaceae bacterium]
MDAVIGMVLTAIVMGIVFVIFSILSERLEDFKSQDQAINDINRLAYSLNKDIFESEAMEASGNIISFKGYSGDVVLYHVEPGYILRESPAFADTLRLSVNKVAADTVRSQSGKNVFQRLAIGYVLNTEQMELRFYKKVYPSQLLQAKSIK